MHKPGIASVEVVIQYLLGLASMYNIDNNLLQKNYWHQ